MAIFNVKQGTLRTLPNTLEPGTFWVVSDAGELHVDLEDEIQGTAYRVRIGDFQVFDTLEELRANENKSENALYYIKHYQNEHGIEMGNVMARYDKKTGTYNQINMDTGATSVEVINDVNVARPNVITDVSYDPNKRKITFIMGERAATQEDFDRMSVTLERLDAGLNILGSIKYQIEQERMRATDEEARIEEASNITKSEFTEFKENEFNNVSYDMEVLLGSDKSEEDRAIKSIRTIANEELTEKLIPENAQESLDTLKEIADWIQNHPNEASALNTNINNIRAYVGTIPSQAYSGDVVNYISEHSDKKEATYQGTANIAGKTSQGIVTIKGGVVEQNGKISNDTSKEDIVLVKVATTGKAEDIVLNSNVSAESKFGSLDTSIGNINDILGNVGTSIGSINNSIEELESTVSGLSGGLSGSANIASLLEGVVTLKSGITESNGIIDNTSEEDIILKKLATTGKAVDVTMSNGDDLETYLRNFTPSTQEDTWGSF